VCGGRRAGERGSHRYLRDSPSEKILSICYRFPCVCVCARARVRACVRARVRVCVTYTRILHSGHIKGATCAPVATSYHHIIVTSSHHHIITSSHHHTISSSHHHIIIIASHHHYITSYQRYDLCTSGHITNSSALHRLSLCSKHGTPLYTHELPPFRQWPYHEQPRPSRGSPG